MEKYQDLSILTRRKTQKIHHHEISMIFLELKSILKPILNCHLNTITLIWLCFATRRWKMNGEVWIRAFLRIYTRNEMMKFRFHHRWCFNHFLIYNIYVKNIFWTLKQPKRIEFSDAFLKQFLKFYRQMIDNIVTKYETHVFFIAFFGLYFVFYLYICIFIAVLDLYLYIR